MSQVLHRMAIGGERGMMFGVLGENLLGDDLIVYLVLALGAALFFGNVLALVKPPPRPKPGELAKAPRGRSLLMALVGFFAAVWALGSLIAN